MWQCVYTPCDGVCVHMCICKCARARVCVHAGVSMWVISGLSIHHRFLLTHSTHIPYILIKSLEFMSSETIYVCFIRR